MRSRALMAAFIGFRLGFDGSNRRGSSPYSLGLQTLPSLTRSLRLTQQGGEPLNPVCEIRDRDIKDSACPTHGTIPNGLSGSRTKMNGVPMNQVQGPGQIRERIPHEKQKQTALMRRGRTFPEQGFHRHDTLQLPLQSDEPAIGNFKAR